MKNITICAGLSCDKGHIRPNNEDNIFFDGFYLTEQNRDEAISCFCQPKDDFSVYAVFDGMGGTDYGEEASYIVAETLANLYSEFKGEDEISFADELVIELVKKSNEAICQKAEELGCALMGSTMALVAVYKNTAKFYNVGDSRIYLQRNNNIIQMSIDDSFAQRLHQLGVISREEAASHKDRNKLIQYLGLNSSEMNIDIHMSDEIELIPGDKILICSDGLSEMVSNKTINEIVSRELSLSERCEDLVCEALNNGGKDNVSVVLLEAFENNENNVEEENKKSALSWILFMLAILLAVSVCLAGFSFLKYAIKNINRTETVNSIVLEDEDVPEIKKSENEYVNTVYIIPGAEFDLSAIVTQADLSKNPTYHSEDTNIVSVSSSGNLVAKNVGGTTVVVEDEKQIYKINVEVLNGDVSRGRLPIAERVSDILHKLTDNE